jgi:trigger factor
MSVQEAKIMEVNVERLSPVLLEIRVEVPADHVSSEVEAAYTQLRKTARVNGFRRGKAPKKVLAQMYGKSIRNDVAQRLVESSLQKALTEREIQPLTKPSVEPAELKSKQSFTFKARFEVRPEIEKVEWHGLEATRTKAAVTDEAIDADIERLRLERATEEPVEERAAEKGDLADIGLKFAVAGEEKNEDLNKIEVASGQLLPFLDEALTGMKVGDKKDVTGSFPDNHPMDELKGQEAEFTIELKELKVKVLPEVDDEFAKDCEFDDLKALKADVSEKIGKRLEQQREEDVARQLVTQLCEKNPVPVPPSLVQQQARMTQREMQMVAQMTGQSLDDPQMKERLQMDSEVKVRAGLLMAEIAKEKEIKVTEEDLEAGYAELAAQTGKNVAKIKVEYREKQKRDMLVGMILEDKVLDLMEGEAKITDAVETSDAETSDAETSE